MPAPSAPGSAPAPAAQIAPALVAVSHGPAGAKISLQLDPAALGKVLVSLARPASGGAHVVVTAERPETLLLLQQDRPALQHALDQAGVAPQGREISFALAAPEPPGRLGGDAGFGQPQGSQDGPRGDGSPGGGSGSPGSGGARSQGGQDPGGPGARRAEAARWLRAGIDITA